MRGTKRGLFLLLSTLMLFTSIVFAGFNQTLSSGVQVTDTQTSTTKNSETKITATVQSTWSSEKTNVITLTNTKDKDAKLMFTYSFTSGGDGTATFASTGELENNNGSCSVILSSGGTVTITITAKPEWFSAKTSTLVIDGITLEEVADSATTTFSYDSTYGSVTAGGTAVADGGTVETSADGIELVATAKGGGSFYGWVDNNDVLLSSAANYKYTPTGDATIRAIFAKPNVSDAWFSVIGGGIYDNLNTAATAASGTTAKVVVPVFSGVLPSGDYTIPSGVTLLIPNDDANTLYTTQPGTDKNYDTQPSVYRILTMASGANITVNGAISVAGMQGSLQHADTAHNGAPRGPLGYIDMASGSTIVVNSGANLYVWGYIKGAGSVTINSGGTVYEDFQVMDWRGGTATSSMVGNDKKVFPLSQYYVQNVEVPMTFYPGAFEKVSTAFTISLLGVQRPVPTFIGEGGMFILTSGTMMKDYDEVNDRLIMNVNGNASLSNITITMNVSLMQNITLDSKDYVLPFNSNFTINVKSGNTNVTQDILFLPGAQVVVDENASVTLSSGCAIYVYDADQWSKDYIWAGKYTHRPVVYIAAPAGSTTYGKPVDRSTDLSQDAAILVNGTVDASAGVVYTTSGSDYTGGGANIYSTASGLIKLGATENGSTYQAIQGDSVTYAEIPITPAKLKNGDTANEYKATAGTTSNYVYFADDHGGRWHTEACGGAYETSTKEPTCTEKGSTTNTCACGYSDTETINALGHANVGYEGQAATCTEIGWEAYEACSRCDYTTYAEIAALGHNWVDDGSGGLKCDYCGEKPAAEVSGQAYETLKEALAAAQGTAFVKMLANSDQAVTYEVGKNQSLTLDLAGCTVSNLTLTAADGGELTIIDSTTGGYDGDKAGQLTGGNASNFAGKVFTYIMGDGIAPKHYVGVAVDGGAVEFHRVAVSVTAYRLAFNRGTSKAYITFEGTFRGTEAAGNVLQNVGFSINNGVGEQWYNGTTKLVPGTPADTSKSGKEMPFYYTMSLNGETAATAYTVSSLLDVTYTEELDNSADLTSTQHTMSTTVKAWLTELKGTSDNQTVKDAIDTFLGTAE